jgi:uncharacterized repeat protein (TIGR01451 family)
MRIDDADQRWRAPRLIGVIAALVGTLLVVMLGYTGGAAAVVGASDLSIAKTDSPDPVTAGQNLTYTITVTNPNATGGGDASNVVVTDTLPAGVDFVSATGGTCSHNGSTVTCNLGQVNAATTATVTIVVKTKKEGTLTNTASVSSPEDAILANNSATAQTTVVKAAAPGNKKGKKKGKGRASCAVPTIKGTPGDDNITGTAGPDVIVTYEGNDQIFAGGGKDLVCAGAGIDLIVGGSGGDTLIGGGGADTLKGNGGGDLLKGKNGRDRLRGQAGNDTLNGGKKRDSCKGGAGSDTLISCP